MTDISGQLLTLQDVAAYLNVAEKTVMRMVRSNAIPAVRVGGQWRFQSADIARWIEHNTQRPESVEDLLRHDPSAVPLDRLIGPSDCLIWDDPVELPEVLDRLSLRVGERYADTDRLLLLESIADRERTAPTWLGQGVLAPHARRPADNPRGSCAVVLAAGSSPIDHHGNAVHVVVLPVARDLVLHLRLMQKIAYTFSSAETAEAIRDRPEHTHEILISQERTR